MAVGILLLSPFCEYQVESQSKVVASPRLKCFKRQSWDLNPDQAGCKSEIVTLLQPGSLYIWKCLTCDWAPKPMWSHIKLTNQVRGPLCVLRRNWDHGTNEKKKKWKNKFTELHSSFCMNHSPSSNSQVCGRRKSPTMKSPQPRQTAPHYPNGLGTSSICSPSWGACKGRSPLI